MTGVLAPLRSGWTYRRWVHLLLGGVPLLPYALLTRGVVGELGPDEAPLVLALLLLMTVMSAEPRAGQFRVAVRLPL